MSWPEGPAALHFLTVPEARSWRQYLCDQLGLKRSGHATTLHSGSGSPRGFEFEAVDVVEIDDLAIAFCRTNRYILATKGSGALKDAENRLLRAHGIPLARIVERYKDGDKRFGKQYKPEQDIHLERALKWHMIQHEARARGAGICAREARAARGIRRGRLLRPQHLSTPSGGQARDRTGIPHV